MAAQSHPFKDCLDWSSSGITVISVLIQTQSIALFYKLEVALRKIMLVLEE